MTREENLIKAKELGIEGAEALNAKDLDKAVKAKIKRNKLEAEAEGLGLKDFKDLSNEDLETAIENENLRSELVTKATALGIDNASDLTSEELSTLILATENTVLSAKLNVFCTALGIDNVSDLSLEELEQVVDGHIVRFNSATTKSVDVNEEQVVEEPKGKTDKAFEAESGKKYVFAADAPASFRFAGAMKTQEEWLADTASMQLMIDGELEYLTQKPE